MSTFLQYLPRAAGNLALYAARLAGGDPGMLTVTAMPSPALGTQLLTTTGGPQAYSPVAQEAQVGLHPAVCISVWLSG